MKWFRRNRMETFIKKEMNVGKYSFKGAGNKVDWAKLKAEIDNYNNTLGHQK